MDGLYLNCADPEHQHSEPEWHSLRKIAADLADRGETQLALEHLATMYGYAKDQFGLGDPCTITLLTNLALRHLAESRPKLALDYVLDALGDLDESCTETAEEHISWLELAATCYRQLQDEQGKACLRKAMKLLTGYADRSGLQMLSLEYRLDKYDDTFDCDEWHRRSSRYAYGKPQEALEKVASCTKELEENADNVHAYYTRGCAHLALTDEEHALSDFNRVVQIAPNEAAGFHGRGLSYEYLGEYEKSLDEYEKAINCLKLHHAPVLKSNQFEVRESVLFHKRGQIFEQLGMLDEALANMSSAIESEPFTSFFYRSRARIYEALGHWELAAADQDKYMKLIKENRSHKTNAY